MNKYRKKPVVIEAMRFEYPPTEALKFWCPAMANVRKNRHPGALGEADITTLEDGKDGRAKHVATEGDWIIKGVAGEFYPCKPDIFAATYEPFVGEEPNMQNIENPETVESTSDERTVNNVMRHEYRVLSGVEKAQMQSIKDIGLEFHDLLEQLGTSRELSLAKTKIEEAVFWSVKHLTK